MPRQCLALDLQNDPALIASYIEYHAAVWPEIRKSLHDAGINDMEIYHVGDRLFMIIEVEDGFSFERKAVTDQRNPRVQEWEAIMSVRQKLLPFAPEGVRWVPMERVFSLIDQDAADNA